VLGLRSEDAHESGRFSVPAKRWDGAFGEDDEMSRTLKGTENQLVLHLKGEYFDAIKSGEKKEEYRLVTTYWFRRLHRPIYEIVLYRGYPKVSDTGLIMRRPWMGFSTKRITHQHFGPNPVNVYAIKVN
jgi:hypothetical protein